MRDAECEKFSDWDLQPRVAGICMMGVDFHRHSAMVGTVEKGERSRPRSRGKRLSAQPLVSAHPDTRVQSCGTTYAPGCRMVRPDGGTCFWRSTSLTVVWGPHHDALTPPQPCVCRDVTVFSSKIHCYAYGTNHTDGWSLTSRACGIVGPRLADRSGSCWVSARAQRVSSCSGDIAY